MSISDIFLFIAKGCKNCIYFMRVDFYSSTF